MWDKLNPEQQEGWNEVASRSNAVATRNRAKRKQITRENDKKRQCIEAPSEALQIVEASGNSNSLALVPLLHWYADRDGEADPKDIDFNTIEVKPPKMAQNQTGPLADTQILLAVQKMEAVAEKKAIKTLAMEFNPQTTVGATDDHQVPKKTPEQKRCGPVCYGTGPFSHPASTIQFHKQLVSKLWAMVNSLGSAQKAARCDDDDNEDDSDDFVRRR